MSTGETSRMASGYPLRHGARIARVCSGMLQASYMRKWMSERLKRRKKDGDGAAKDAAKAPEPLQPRFYDNEPAAAPPEAPAEPRGGDRGDVSVEAPVVVSRRASRPAPEPAPAPQTVSAGDAPVGGGESKPRVARRRRSRGGRGGSRSRPAAAAAAVSSPPEASEGEGVALQPESVAKSTVAPAHATTAPAAPASARASKGTVVLAIGLPGSGKSSWFKRHSIHPLSSDLLRELLFDDAQEQRFQDLVFSNLRSMLKARLIARRPMNYVDATNLTPHDRHSWIKLAKDYGYDVQGLYFDVPLEVCMERHQRRGRAIPEDIMRKMAGKLKAPTFEEGFSKITVVRVKQKDGAAPENTSEPVNP
jgi:predicted kinase